MISLIVHDIVMMLIGLSGTIFLSIFGCSSPLILLAVFPFSLFLAGLLSLDDSIRINKIYKISEKILENDVFDE